MHFYVYYKSKGFWVYERTTGSLARAKERVKELLELYKREDALYTVDQTIRDAFY